MSTQILILRHGETAWNRGTIFRGTYDIPLNKNGKQQARLAAEALKDTVIDVAYTSPLSRASESAAIVTECHGITPVPHDGFLDLDYGEWTGKEDSEVAKTWPNEHKAWTTNPHSVRPPGGTTLKEVFYRSFTAMEELAERHDGGTIAIVAHRVVNKLLIMGALSLGLERFPFIIQGNCCINRIEKIRSGYLIHSINDVSHIKNAGTALLDTDF
jgi:phosphoserine phosphatase